LPSSYIDIAAPGGGTFKAFLATPLAGSGPGLVVLQEIFGVNAAIRATAERLAEEGYVVLAPDMFWRAKPGFDVGYS